MSDKVVEIITEKILAALESGVKPWERPWRNGESGLYMGQNLKTGNRYSGINQLQLMLTAAENNYDSQYWLTAKQAQELGGTIRKGEKGTPIIWAAPFQDLKCTRCGHEYKGDREKPCPKCKADDPATGDGGFGWRYYRVFNVEQIDGIDYPKAAPRPVRTGPERCTQAEHILKASGAVIRHGGDRAYYSPGSDRIQLPHLEQFSTSEGYYSTALHELTHWTGHKARLARDFSGRFGDSAYAFEELVAEMGSAYLCAHVGLAPIIEHHASYIDNWIKAIKEKPRALIEACSKASKAYDYVLSLADAVPQTEEQPAPVAPPTPQPVTLPTPQPVPGNVPPTKLKPKHGVSKDDRQTLLDQLILYFATAPVPNGEHPGYITVTYGTTEYRIVHSHQALARVMKALGFGQHLKDLTEGWDPKSVINTHHPDFIRAA